MIKKGFTLTEVLITLAVVGVASALIAPAVSNLLPNKDKIEFLNAYNAINQTTQDLLNNANVYYTKYKVNSETDISEPSCQGLECTDNPYDPSYAIVADNDSDMYMKGSNGSSAIFSGNTKYINLMIKSLSKDENLQFANAGATSGTLMLSKNVSCLIEHVGDDDNDILYRATIKLLNGSGKDCEYNKNTCTNPDKFILDINKFGNIKGHDPLSRVYLKNPNDTNNKKADLINASRL